MADQPVDPVAVEQQLAEDLEAITDAQTRALVAAWALAWSEISGELFDTLNDLAAAGTRITAAVLVRTQRLQQVLALIADKLEDLATEAAVTITTDLADVVDQAVTGQSMLMAAQVLDDERRDRLDLDRRPPARELDAIVRRFQDRVTSSTAPLADETYEVIQRELIRGVALGANPRETARRMVERAEDDWNFGLTRALTISRTETLDAYREGARSSQDEHADVLAGWLWLAHFGKGRAPCRSCLAMHGRLFDLDVEGPNDHQQGRCSRCPVVKDEDGEPDLSWVPDVDEHFESLTVAEQQAILGKAGFRAWANGDFPREQWTRTRSVDGWRDAQVPASPGDPAGGSGTTGPTPGGPTLHDDDGTVLPIDQLVEYDGELRGSATPRSRYTAQGVTVGGYVADPDDPWEHFDPAEEAAAEWLRDRGVDVLSVSDANDVGRTPDAVTLDGLATIEFKRLNKASAVTVRRAISRSTGQSDRVLVDGRGAGLDLATAAEGIARALGLVGAEMTELAVLLEDGSSVGWRRG